MPPKAVKVAHRARLEVDARRAQLIALGLEQFSGRAYDEVSIEDVAHAAGISKGLLYHYFPTKRDYYVATLREAASQLLSLTETSSDLAPLERLSAGIDAYLDYVERHGPAYAALMRGGIGSDPEVAAIVDGTRAAFVDRLVSESPIASPSPTLRMAMRGWLGMVEATSLEWYVGRAIPRAVLRDLLAAMLPNVVQLGVQLSAAPPRADEPGPPRSMKTPKRPAAKRPTKRRA
jgi:AcrR family transcriptional regulator